MCTLYFQELYCKTYNRLAQYTPGTQLQQEGWCCVGWGGGAGTLEGGGRGSIHALLHCLPQLHWPWVRCRPPSVPPPHIQHCQPCWCHQTWFMKRITDDCCSLENSVCWRSWKRVWTVHDWLKRKGGCLRANFIVFHCGLKAPKWKKLNGVNDL